MGAQKLCGARRLTCVDGGDDLQMHGPDLPVCMMLRANDPFLDAPLECYKLYSAFDTSLTSSIMQRMHWLSDRVPGLHSSLTSTKEGVQILQLLSDVLYEAKD